MLIDRMVEGHGAQALRPLDDATAQEVIRERLQTAVWDKLAGDRPPADEPCFPFTLAEVRQMRIDTGGELRAFLQRAAGEFERRLNHPIGPPRLPPIHVASVEPREVISHEPAALLIRGTNFPAEVRVLFDGKPGPTEPVCRPDAGEIDVTTPAGLVGDIAVRVEAADDASNGASVVLTFVTREVPRPYCMHIDREKLQARRRKLGLSQTEVAEKVGSRQQYISRLETGSWSKAPDELYTRLAEIYGLPLSSFLKG